MATTFQRTPTVQNYINSQIVDANYSNGLTAEYPEVGDMLIRPYGLGYLSSLVSMIGNKNTISNPHYSHAEENRIRDVIVATATAGAAGAEVTFTVDASKRATISNSASPEYIASGTTDVTMPQKYDVILVPDGSNAWVQCVVSETTSSNTFKAVPKISGENIPTVTTAVEIPIIGTQFGEGSSEPDAVNPTLTSYTNNTQVFRKKAKVSRTAKSTLTWFDNLGENENESGWFYEGVRTQKANLMNDKETTLLVGEGTTNTTAAALSGLGTAKSTTGLVPFTEANGQREQYTSGSLALTDLESMSKKIFKQRGSTENMLPAGHDFIFEMDNLIRTSEGLKAGGVQYAGMGGEKRAVNLGFDSVNYGGITYHYKPLEVFTSPELLGAEGLTYKNMGLVIPLGNTIAAMDEFTDDRQEVPNLRINCLRDAEHGDSEYIEVAYNGLQTNGNDDFVINMLSECGFEGFAGQRFGQFYV